MRQCSRALESVSYTHLCVASQPAYKFERDAFCLWMERIEAFAAADNVNVYAENALNQLLASEITLLPMELSGRLCSEIDNPEDRDAVSARFMPFSYTHLNRL